MKEQDRKWEKQDKKKPGRTTGHRNLLLCMGGLFLLVVLAFAGPYLLLKIQDKSRLTQSVSTKNTGTDYTVWQENYETDTVRRLQKLADGIAAGKQYYVSEQEYVAETDGEIFDLLQKYIIDTEWNYLFQDVGMIPEDYFYKYLDADHISIKRYILYDEKMTDGVAIMAYDICVRGQEPEDTGVSVECIVDSETGTLYAMKVVLENETEPVTWEDIDADAPYYFITDYMQSYLQDSASGTYIEIQGEAQMDANAQVLWDDKMKIEANVANAQSAAVNSQDNAGEYTYDLDYGEHSLHFLITLLNASEGQLEKGVGYLFGIQEITEQIPGFLPEP